MISLSVVRRSPYSVTWMEFSTDDVTGAGHHGTYVGGGWWKGKVLTGSGEEDNERGSSARLVPGAPSGGPM